MTWELFFGCVIIALARVGDVSLGSMRTVAVVSGHRILAWIFGLLEVTIWVFVVSAVVTQLREEPVYGVAFAFGAATGNYLGVTVLRWFPFGNQVIRVFTRKGAELFTDLCEKGFRVTRFEGTGRDGAVSMMFIQIPRSKTQLVINAARSFDPECFYTVDDIRAASVSTIARPSLPAETES